MHRWRVEEQVERLTRLLRSRESLPHSLYGLLYEHGINPDKTALTDFVEDQGCCLGGTLLTSDGKVISFDIDFEGDAYGAWSGWGAIISINEWTEHLLNDERPKQGSPLDVAARLMRAGRL
jgi:hypothetical protein